MKPDDGPGRARPGDPRPWDGPAVMTCDRFLEAFTDLRDGRATPDLRRQAEAHLEACADCRHYRRVVDRGLEVLKGEEPLDVPEDFGPRLRHRLYHVDDEKALHRHVNSGATGTAVLGIALVLAAVAWSPVLRPAEPTVELSPIVVSRPPSPLGLRPVGRAMELRPMSASRTSRDLWDDAHSLLFQYSPVSERYRQRALVRTGVDDDR